jgi:hypothetical protein
MDDDSLDTFSDWQDWSDDGSNTDNTVPVIGSQPASTSQPTSSTGWFSSLLNTISSATKTAQQLTGNPNAQTVASTATASSLLTWIPLAIAAVAIGLVVMLMFRKK